ncbi:MAG: AbrB/MazE/SpoVT family DNA-binding domain-containing protein, partial [Planctomycetes bacterium]|nr:AbrB/MazE/SpoVT family DNA-binding domain-containing protein [Planctomycetota bacterium]
MEENPDDDRGELRWYLEEYLQFPYGAERERAQRVEAAMERWGEATARGHSFAARWDYCNTVLRRGRRAEMLVKLTERGTITIPKELRGQLPADSLLDVVLRDDGVIELRPQLTVDATQAWFWSERWQRMEREADEDYRRGRYETFDDVESFLAE